MAPHYLIAVSEGRFRVLERFARPGQLTPALREVANHDFLPARGAYPAREIDRARRFPFGGLRVARALDAQGPAQEDDQRRTVDWLAEQIENFLLARLGQPWAFAASPSLGLPVLEGLRPSLRGSMVALVQQDLSAMRSHQVLAALPGRSVW